MTQEQVKLIERAFSHGDDLVFQVGERVFVSDTIIKSPRTGLIRMKYCSEIDLSCFNPDGSYDGDVLDDVYTITLKDHFSGIDSVVETRYYNDELVSIHKSVETTILF